MDPSAPDDKDPPWLRLAMAQRGCHERLPDGTLNPLVRAMFSVTRFPTGLINLKTAWCAAFVGSCLEQAGYRSSRSAAARSYLTWGRELAKMRRGAVLVFLRGNVATTGHVGFYVDETPTHLLVLGGNQKDCVGIDRYPKDRLLSVRWPTATLPAPKPPKRG